MKPLAFAGFQMSVPDDWEVSTIEARNDEFAITVQGLQSPTLEVRWQEVGLKKAKEDAKRRGKPVSKKLMGPDEVME
ncbi:MAG: hypothetical protein ACP5UU_06085, partial [Thermoprotei archaeon]